MRTKARNGQTALEYVLALLAVIVIVSAMGYMITAAERSAERSEAIVASEYP